MPAQANHKSMLLQAKAWHLVMDELTEVMA